jgi:hypothetical protein
MDSRISSTVCFGIAVVHDPSIDNSIVTSGCTVRISEEGLDSRDCVGGIVYLINCM